jgi:NhaP-type Na+/H+ and K+/H+ antiporter
VALVLAGAGLGRPAAAFVGWFGPRGLASVVFALLALEDLGERVAGPAVTVIAVTVLLSVVAHGASAGPLIRRRGPLLAPAASGDDPAGPPEMPARRLIRRERMPGTGPAPPAAPE